MNKQKSVIDVRGNVRWYNNDGKLHREDGPAITIPGSNLEEWWLNGVHYTQEQFIARINKNKKSTCKRITDKKRAKYRYDTNGKLHREDGPAIEYADGSKEWYINGKKLTETQFNVHINKKKPGIKSPSLKSDIGNVLCTLIQLNNELKHLGLTITPL